MQGQKIAPRLTIVLPLKGRHLFTLRFLWHANKARLPYRLLIADGQVDEAVASYLENSCDIFPNLDIEYVRYPNDSDYSRFFAKMSDALSRVRTPYAMMADNDDFLGIQGIEQALDFLDANADYVCACGRAAAFSVYAALGNPDGGVRGRLNRLYIASNPKDVAAPMAAERLRQGGVYALVYYAVYRTEAVATIWRETAEIDFSDLMLHENFHALRTLTLGKVRSNKAAINHFAQIGTSLSVQPSRNWVRDLLRSRFTVDAHAVVDRVAAAAVTGDGAEAATIAEDVRNIIEQYFREFLSTNFGLVTAIKRYLRKKWPRLVTALQNRPHFFVGRQRSAVLSQLAMDGASEDYLARSRGELADIEDALSPAAFASFAGPFLQVARADGSRNWF